MSALALQAQWSKKFASPFEDPGSGIRDMNPGVFYFVSWTLHLFNVVLIFWLLNQVGLSSWSAFGGSLLFAWHPLQVENLAWFVGQRDQWMVFFSLLFLNCIWKWRSNLSFWRLAILSIFHLLAVFSKPTSMMNPLIVFILLWLEQRESAPLWKLAPLFSISALAFVLTRSSQSLEQLTYDPSIFERLWICLDTLGFYLWKLIFPWPLLFDYGRSPETLSIAKGSFVLWIFPLIVGFWIWKRRKIFSSEVWLGLFLFFLPLLPVLGLVSFTFQNLSSVADRYLSLSLVGVSILVSRVRFPRSWLALALVWAALSFQQLFKWKDSVSLWSHVVHHNPRSWFAWNNWASYHEIRNERSLAIPKYLESVSLRPRAIVYVRVGIMQYELGELRQALQSFEKALILEPRLAIAQHNRQLILQELQGSSKK